MNRTYYSFGLTVIITTILFFCFFSCSNETKKQVDNKVISLNKLNEIHERGTLIAVTDYNSTNYFLYKGQTLGFQYELLLQYARHIDVKLEILVSNDLEEKFDLLEREECDLIAINMTVTKERSKRVDFTVPHTESRQVLIQRKPNGWENMSKKTLEDSLLRNQLNLAGKKVYIQANSSFRKRLENLMEEIGDTIYIIDTTEYGAEQLITMVSKGEIEYTVSDENVAMVNSTYYPGIDVETAISFPQKLAWAVKPGSDSLLANINSWMEEFKNTRRFKGIYRKYFKSSKSARRVQSDYYSLKSGKISQYDNSFRKYSKIIGWDWRLLASLVYQESNFTHDAESWAGAYGLMQLMPATAERFGCDSTSSPEANILAGVKFLKWLDEKMIDKVEDDEERLKFVLASYNVGLGHILDARKLAEKHNKDTNTWEENVDYYLLNKSNPKYYRDPVVKHGYCRGEEPYKYVYEILERYEHYKNTIPE